PGNEVGVVHDGEVRRNGRGDAGYLELLEGPPPAGDGCLPCRSPDDQLRHEVVVVLGDGCTGRDPGVDPHPETGGLDPLHHLSGGWQEAVVWVLGVDPELDGVAAGLGVAETELLAVGDSYLPLHQVEAGHHLGDGVLDLEPGVHLEEVELAALVDEELDGAGVGITARLGGGEGGPSEVASLTRVEAGGRRLL